MPSYKRSRYPKVNERRRKAEWNSRSTGQLGRQRRERQEDLNAAWTTERKGQRSRHGLVNTGYLASLMTDREAILREARGEVEVGPSFDGRNRPYTRAPPALAPPSPAEQEAMAVENAHEVEAEPTKMLVEPTADGRWLAHLPNGSTKTFTYKVEANSAARSLV